MMEQWNNVFKGKETTNPGLLIFEPIIPIIQYSNIPLFRAAGGATGG
jgi:hypothetical protein